MSVTASNLIQGPGTLYQGLFGAAEPADTAINSSPAASAWTDVGATQDGVTVEIDITYSELTCDQLIDTPERRITKRETTLTTNLAEPTLAHLATVMNTAAPTTGASADFLEPVADLTATQPVYSALIFDGFAPGGFRRRVAARKVLQTDKIQIAYKLADQTVLSAQFTTHWVSSSIRPIRYADGKS